MKPNEHDPNSTNGWNGIGGELGDEAFEHAEIHGEEYCAHERQRIEIENQPKIAALQAELALLQEEDEQLEERIRNAPPAGDARTRRQKRLFYWCLAGVLIAGGLAFTIYGLLPFRFGVLLWIIAGAIAILTPFSLDETIEAWENSQYARLSKAVVTTFFVTAITAQLLLGSIRAEVMQQQFTNGAPAVVVEGETGAVDSERQPTFYERTQWCLMLFLPLLALAMELGAGWALWKARRYGTEGQDDLDELRGKRREIRQRMIQLAAEMKRLQAAGAEFEHRFQRDFRRNFRNRSKGGKFLNLPAIFLLVFLGGLGRVHATERLNLVLAADLSGSVAKARGLDGKTELDRNLAAVSKMLAKVPAGAKVTVLAITDLTFSRPYVLLSAEIDPDAGYFGERIAAVRRTLVQTWQTRSRSFISQFQRTDLLGSLVVASQLFQARAGWRNVLIIFSDMRDTHGINLNTAKVVPVDSSLKRAETGHLIADLKGVSVYVLGVDGAEKEVGYWQTLREFWVQYFKKSGAELRAYSMMRDVPDFSH